MSKGGDNSVTVLVVEDNGELRSMMRRELKERGYRVLTAQDAEEAVDLVECLSCRWPQFIMTDLEMPGLYNLLKVAAAHPMLNNIPVVTVEPEYLGPHDERVTLMKDYDELNDLLG